MPEACDPIDYWWDRERDKPASRFDDMYQEIEDPWSCDRHVNSLSRSILLWMCEESGPFTTMLAIGCGTGGLTRRLFAALTAHDGTCAGLDISPTAVARAEKSSPSNRLEFHVGDCRSALPTADYYDLKVMSDVVWYIVDQFSTVLAALRASLAPNGSLAIHQYFPSNQQFGTCYLKGLDDFIKLIGEAGFVFTSRAECIDPESGDRVLVAVLKSA